VSDPILDPLNDEQRKAVTHVEGPLLILAGAGSGKTRVITHRIAHLVRDHEVPPYRILGVTFTNKAADEMQERTRELVGRQSLQPELSTFHSFGVDFIREEIGALERDQNFSIYDSTDQKNLIKECMQDLGINTDRLEPQDVQNRISRAKDQGHLPDEYELEGDNVDERVLSVYQEYQDRLREYNAFDFGDLLVYPVVLMRRNETIRERWTSGPQSFRFIMIDEFQDTNPAQYELAEQLSSAHGNLAVVGDDDQSIYSWRGADVSNILDFEGDFPETKTVRLEKNYRSTEPILDAAHSIISNNSYRKEKKLWTDRDEGNEPTVHAADSDYDEAEFVVDTIGMLEKIKGISPGDVAIFFRMNAQTRVFEEVFNRENIPYEIVSGVGFYERKEIKDLMAYLSILVNPDDDQSLRRIINTPSRGIGAKTLEALEHVAEVEGVSMVEALEHLDTHDEVSGRAQSSLETFRDLYRSLKELREAQPTEVIEAVLDETNYIDEEYSSEDTERRESRRENVEELKRVADNFQTETADADLAKFLEEATLLQDVDTLEEESQRVKMMTLHAAKGLEFPVVFMAGMEEGLLPHSNSEYDEDRREEERRLCYVGFTRAQDRLYCTWSRSRWMYGREQSNNPSRFLKEAGLMDQQTTSSGGDPFTRSSSTDQARAESSASTASGNSSKTSPSPKPGDDSSEDLPDLEEGDIVKHPKFGEGQVLGVSGSGTSPVVKIDFDTGGVKELALSFARLEQV
jgi:DNA helicase-2/ATP-dependent DNA helicase PcrA